MSHVRVLIPARSSNLISLSQVKLYLSETTTDNDTLYSRLITAASSDMIRAIGVSPARQKYEEIGIGQGGYTRYLSRLPVEAGTLSISYNGEVLVEGIEADNWVLQDPATGLIYRQSGWHYTSLYTVDTYYAGFLLPDQVADWTASTSYTVGSFVRTPLSSDLLRFECTTAGTSGASSPSWPSTIGATVTDNTAVWTARAAVELPPFVSQWCYAEVLRQLGNLNWRPGLASRTVEGVSESVFATHTDGVLSRGVAAGIASWRLELGLVGVA